jgi:integrase
VLMSSRCASGIITARCWSTWHRPENQPDPPRGRGVLGVGDHRNTSPVGSSPGRTIRDHPPRAGVLPTARHRRSRAAVTDRPSKGNEERLLLVSPELASVLATVITRLRAGNAGTVPLVARYDQHERLTGPPLPHLFQRAHGARRESMSPRTVYRLINTVLAAAGIRDATGKPLAWRPHDFRRWLCDRGRDRGPSRAHRSPATRP